MLLAGKGNISDRQAFFSQRFHHHFRLVWRHHSIFQALKENDGAGQAVGEIYRRPFEIEITPFRVRTNQAIEITRLKLVRFFSQGLGIAATVINIQHSDSTAGPILKARTKCCGRRRRRSAMALYQEWRPFIFRRDKVSVLWRIKETIRSLTLFSWKLDRLWLRDVTGIDLNIIRAPQDLRLTRS